MNVDGAPQLLKRAAIARARRRRRPPAIGVGKSTGAPIVYYLCPDHDKPSGGVRAIYRHVDVLNAAGIRATVLHHRDGFAASWFEHSTPVIGAARAMLSGRDTLVVPEIYGPYFERLPRGPRLVAFNQNAYLTFDGLAPGQRLSYDRFDAALAVSPDNAEFLRFAIPGLDVSVVSNAVDPEVFRPAAEPPPRRLALMPRKRSAEAEQILRLLGPRLAGWEVVTISSSSEAEVAAALRAAPIFLALGKQEGFGLPAAEAMASGCFVVGFPAFGGREIFDPAFSRPVEDGDVLAAARELAAAMASYEEDPRLLREDGARARRHIEASFPPERQRRELVEFFAGRAAPRRKRQVREPVTR